MATMNARVRPKGEFLYRPVAAFEVVPNADYAGCYVLRHEFRPKAVPPEPAHIYTVALYVDVAAGPVTIRLHDDGGGLVVDVPEGFNDSTLTDVVNASRRASEARDGDVASASGGPDGPVVVVYNRP
jgi:hypothetical protein